MTRPDLERTLVALFDNAGDLDAADRATVRAGVALVLRAVALRGTPRGARAAAALAAANRAAEDAPALVVEALAAPSPARPVARPLGRRARPFYQRRRGAMLAREA